MEDRRQLTIIVNTLVDAIDGSIVDGTISLRDAIAAAAPNDFINFDAALFANGPATLTLTLNDVPINKPLSISGPGADLLTINSSGNDPTPNQNNGDGDRVFLIDDGIGGTLSFVFIGNITITGGDSLGDGGGIFNRENLSIADCVITGNAADDGGGLYNVSGYLTLNRTTVSDNASLDDGGGIANVDGRVTVRESTLSGNDAGDAGGGIANVSDLSGFRNATLRNSTVSGNSSSGFGGGVFNFSGLTIVEFSTITNNHALNTPTSGVATWGDALTTRTDVNHSIIAGNIGSDVAHVTGLPGPTNTFNSLGYNLIGLGASVPEFNQVGDQPNVNSPRLAPLGDYGGSTKTHPLLFHSPAIDAGNPIAFAGVNGVPNFDQRGAPRIEDGDDAGGSRLDIGAIENGAKYFLVEHSGDENDGNFSIGDLSLREAVVLANATLSHDTIFFQETLNGQQIVLSLGELTITDAVTIDATSLPAGLVVDASDNDPMPNTDQGDGSRVLVIDDGDNFNAREVTIRGLTLTGADYANAGGAIFNRESLELSASILSSNAAQWGGGIYNAEYGDLSISWSNISGNTARSSGGGVYNFAGIAAIDESTISNNVAIVAAGIRNNHYGQLTVTRSTISGNTATDPISGGGGIRNDSGYVTILDSTLSGNSAAYGGGLYVATPLNYLTLVRNTTISGNQAPLGGAGIYNFAGHTVIELSTITENNSNDFAGSGIVSWGDAFLVETEIYSSIIAGNHHTDMAVAGFPNTFQSIGYNLVGVFGFVGDLDSTDVVINGNDPLLGPLDDNGGPTLTHALLPASFAVDSGDPLFSGPPLFDQRGAPFPRVVNGQIDRGALESETAVVDGDFNNDGLYDLVDIDALVAAIAAQTHDSLFDLTGDSLVNLADRDAWLAEAGGVNLGMGRVYRLGDANLDGVVDGSDFGIWNSNKFTSVARWSKGDFTADGVVDGSDFGAWNSNKFTSSLVLRRLRVPYSTSQHALSDTSHS